MPKFVEFMLESGSPITVNVDQVMSFSALGGDETRGTALQFAYSTGERFVTRVVKVQEPYAKVRQLLGA